MFKSLYKLALAGLALGLLAGCGGGSGGSQLSPVSTTPTVTLTTKANEVASGSSIQVTAVVKDSNGNVLPGTIVTFSVSDSASATLKSSKIVTEPDGSATTFLSANAVSADTAVAVTASADVLSVSGTTTKTTTVTATTNLKVTQSTATATRTLAYVSATPTRLVIAGASAGSGTLSESSVITYKVLNTTSDDCKSVLVYFNLSTFNGGVTLNGLPSKGSSPAPVPVKADSSCLATVTIQSGTEPESIKVSASLSSDMSSSVVASDQIAISSSIPDQSHFKLYWQSGASCSPASTATVVTYPCAVTVNVGDFLGHPVPDGTIVVFAISQGGLVVGSTDSNSKATGYCTTSSGQCTANVWGDPLGNNELVAYAIGDYKTVVASNFCDDVTNPTGVNSTSICVHKRSGGSLVPSTTTGPNPTIIITGGTNSAADGTQGKNDGDFYVRAHLNW